MCLSSPLLSCSGDILCISAPGPRLGSHTHVPVRHHLPPDLPSQLQHHLLGLHGVGHWHLPPRTLRLLPAAPHQRGPCLPTELRFNTFIHQYLCMLQMVWFPRWLVCRNLMNLAYTFWSRLEACVVLLYCPLLAVVSFFCSPQSIIILNC